MSAAALSGAKGGKTLATAVAEVLARTLNFHVEEGWVSLFLKTYSVDFIMIVFLRIYTNHPPTHNDLPEIEKNTKLIPPNLQTPFSYDHLLKAVREVKPPDQPVLATRKPGRSIISLFDSRKELLNMSEELRAEVLKYEAAITELPSVEAIISSDDPEAKFAARYPYRTAKDKSIRRTRFRDVRDAAVKLKQTNNLTLLMHKATNSLDYVACCNILWYYLMTSDITPNPILTLGRVGALSHGLEHFIAVTKLVNDLVKGRESLLDERIWGEMSNLAGFRNLPFEGFNLQGEIDKLTKGSGFDRLSLEAVNFLTATDNALQVEKTNVEYLSFKDYVLSGMWVTSGATQFVSDRDPHLKFEWAGEKVKIKIGKNAVPHLFSLAELADDARHNKVQRNNAISKCETGKIRLAVASDMETYLQQSWIVHLTGGQYRKWPGVTLEETPTDTICRELEMLSVMAGRLSMPFDYKGFDNQPSLTEVTHIWNRLVKMAKKQHAALSTRRDRRDWK